MSKQKGAAWLLLFVYSFENAREGSLGPIGMSKRVPVRAQMLLDGTGMNLAT
jgi:hypothetical protein